MKTKGISKHNARECKKRKGDFFTLCFDCWPKDKISGEDLGVNHKRLLPVTMEGMDKNGCCAVCGRSWREQNEMEKKRLEKKLDPKIAMELIDKLKVHKGIRSLKLKWYIVPHPEVDDYLLFAAKKKLKQYPDCDYVGASLPYDGVTKDMNQEIENVFLSIKDVIVESEQLLY